MSEARDFEADDRLEESDDPEPEELHPPVLEPGAELAPGYEVVAHLHRSNKFDVYDVYSAERACRCVAKTPIPPDIEDDEADGDRASESEREEELYEYERASRGLVREWNLLRKLTHPHIIRAYEVVREPRTVLITETLTGSTLSNLIDERPTRMPLAELTHLGLHLCSAVHYLHYKGILHLDLKPSNVVSERGMGKILDLSIARKPGRVKRGAGTLHYLSPEQAAGSHAGPPADVWGVGAVLFEATTDVLPFHAAGAEASTGTFTSSEDESRREYEQLKRRADPVGRHRRVPKEFASIIDDCLQPEPGGRPTIQEVSRRLEDFARSNGF